MLKKSVRRKEAIITILPSHVELSSDVVTISNQKIVRKGTFGVVSVGHVKTLDSFCVVLRKKNILVIPMPYLKQEHFPYVLSVIDGKLVIELITCEDNKGFSLFYNTSAKHERHKYHMNDTSETRETRMLHECYTNDTSEKF